MKEVKHRCAEGGGFGIEFVPYPMAIYGCRKYRKPLRSIPVDDLSERDFDLAIKMISRYREDHGSR